MANNLTGNYDAVLLVRVKTINAILATLHQNGADEDASPTFLHTATTRLGGRPPNPPSPAVGTRGIARVQLSAPAISFPSGSTSEVMVHVHARAHYTPDPGTLALPAPIHGEVRTVCLVTVKKPWCFGSVKRVLEVNLPQQDSKIQFQPAAGVGLSPMEHGQLLAAIRKTVRESFEPVNTEVPDGFPFGPFKELGAGQALALPISLAPGVEPPAQALNTLANNFLNDDFSIGISRQFVEKQLQPTLENLKKFRRDFEVSISLGPFSVGVTTYHISVKSVGLEWKNGVIILIIKANATASLAPDYEVTVRQGLRLTIDPGSQRVTLQGSNNDLSVSVSGFGGGFLVSRVRNSIIPVRNSELPKAEKLINKQLTDPGGALPRIKDGLKSLDGSAAAGFSAVRITPDGLILDGRISTANRRAPVVSFEETRDGRGFTALESWIPAGRVDRFMWSWVLRNSLSVWGQHVEQRTESHTFILPKPSPPSKRFVVGDVCLRIAGVRLDSLGNAITVHGGAMCSISRPDVVWRPPAGTDMPLLPLWEPEIGPDARLSEAISGLVSLSPDRPLHSAASHSLVHFADPRLDRPLHALGKALARVRQKTGFLAFIVLPEGAFDGRKAEVEARIGSVSEEFPGHLVLTEDYEGAWRRNFGVERLPATVLLNREGAPVWRHEGSMEGEGLGKAVDEFFVSGRAPRFRPLGISRAQCDQLPQIVLSDDRGQTLALRKLRGHRVLLNFWKSRSAPSLRELQRLQKLCGLELEDLPVIVAVNGGEKADVLSRIRRSYNLDFALAPDPDGAVSRQFGIECWPTTLSINPEGKLDGVQFGTAREYTTEREGTDAIAGAAGRG